MDYVLLSPQTQDCIEQTFPSDVLFRNSNIVLDNTECSFDIRAPGYSVLLDNSQVFAPRILVAGADISINESSSLSTGARGIATDSRQNGFHEGGGGHAGYGGEGCTPSSSETNYGGPAGTLLPTTSGGAARAVEPAVVLLGGGHVFLNASNSLVVDGFVGAEGDSYTAPAIVPVPVPTPAAFAQLARGADASLLADADAWELAGGVRALSPWLHAYALQLRDAAQRLRALQTLPSAIARATAAVMRHRLGDARKLTDSSASGSAATARVLRAALRNTVFADAIPASPAHVRVDNGDTLAESGDAGEVRMSVAALLSPLLLVDITPHTLANVVAAVDAAHADPAAVSERLLAPIAIDRKSVV